ncbi:MAG: alanine:cation symporter family protein [Clostridia bacterium]|nr:alanine:cation symporter family protein [Clostridia bacterium]
MLLIFMLVGLYFSSRSGFFQLTHLGMWLKATFLALFRTDTYKTDSSGEISQMGAISTALAATIGTGSVVGVATALTLGGAGSIFWMWISSFLGMMTAYAENVLGIKYRYKNGNGEWVGGAMVYMEKGVKMKWLAAMFSVFCIFSSLGIGNMTQANSIAYAVRDVSGISERTTAGFLCVIIGIIIVGGIKRISSFTARLIPVIAIAYTLGCIVVIFGNIKNVPSAIGSIFSEAFSLRSAGGGIFASVMLRSMRFGVSRGVFSNEAGLGTSVAVHCASNIREPAEQGMWSIFEVFVDTMVVCTLTALCILSSGCDLVETDSVRLCSLAFSSVLGGFGYYFVSAAIILFSFATLMSGSYLGERSTQYVFGQRASKLYRIAYIGAIFVGCCADLELVWQISDTFNGLLAIPNLFSIMVLSPEVFRITDDYLRKIKLKKLEN